jgi:hypothetical protein
MLVKAYRHGPTRQRLLKGYILAGKEAEAVAKQVCKDWRGSPGKGDAPQVSVRIDERHPTSIWLDTGDVWLHTAGARDAMFGRLNDSLRALIREVKARGATLLPNALQSNPVPDWGKATCGDEHILETNDDVEREVANNYIRQFTPALIALAGRCGLSSEGIDRLGSRRLTVSTHHYAARYLPSVSPLHLGRVVRELQREQGISRIDLLDISPVSQLTDGSSAIHLRFFDAQILLSTARAHAILAQAMMIRTRRLVQEGRRIGAVRQAIINRNRGRAIASGMSARFETDVDRRGSQNVRDENPQFHRLNLTPP